MFDSSRNLSFTTKFSAILVALLFHDVTLSPGSAVLWWPGVCVRTARVGIGMLHLRPHFITQFIRFLEFLFAGDYYFHSHPKCFQTWQCSSLHDPP